MKNIKRMITVIGMMMLIGMNMMSVNAINVDVDGNKMVRSNASNRLEYQYEVTSIEGNEVHGIALNHVSYDNSGIFLYDDELEFNAKVGDKIVVEYGIYGDDILSVDLKEID